jgi:hypothetical protein
MTRVPYGGSFRASLSLLRMRLLAAWLSGLILGSYGVLSKASSVKASLYLN